MADSLAEIVAVSLNDTNFSGGYTLLTTNSTTSYAIKDVTVSGGYYLSIPAAINGFPIGDFKESLSGSEIMDVSSSLTLTADPYAYSNISYEDYNPDSDVYISALSPSINDKAGTTITNTTTSVSLASHVAWTGTSDYSPVHKVNNSYYQIDSNGNATQKLFYWATAGSARTTISSASYNPIVYAKDKQKYYYADGTAIKSHDPVNGVLTIRTGVPTTSWLSYPRMAYCNGYVFWQQKNTDLQAVYALNVTNGAYFAITGMNSIITMSTQHNLAVSYDAGTDKFSIYRRPSTYNSSSYPWIRTIVDFTKTSMDAKATNSNTTLGVNDHTEQTQTGNIISSKLIGYINSYGVGMLHGSASEGDKFYYTNYRNSIYEFNWSTQTATKVSSPNLGSAGGLPVSIYTPNSAENTATAYDPPHDVKIRITGVKSVA